MPATIASAMLGAPGTEPPAGGEAKFVRRHPGLSEGLDADLFTSA
jgi:hypothetical protein